jgi:fibronectin type 3 domain-containing protein
MKTLLFTLLTILTFCLSTALAGDVTLEWDPNTEPDLAGYYVYQAERIGDKTTPWERITTDLFTQTIFIVTALSDKNYAWMVTAVDTRGNESFVSNMVERFDRTPPGQPKNLRKYGE